MAITSLKAAKRACARSGWSLSDLKLQKILYLAHMLYAGATQGNKSLIDGHFEAWQYGPVLPDLYRWTKLFGSAPIPSGLFRNVGDIDDERAEAKIIDRAVAVFGGLSAWRLVQIVHDKKSAWVRLYDRSKRDIVISQPEIVAEYARRFPQRQPA